MDPKRFVRVTHGAAGPHGGTGYLLHGDRVLTARHVVDGAKDVYVHYDDLTGGGVRTAKATVIWPGDGDLDAVVLAVETELRIARQLLAPVLLPGDAPYRSRGWARAGAAVSESAGIVSSMTGLRGMAYELVEGARSFELSVEAPPDGVEWWRGVSGAPVFCDRRLVGVIEGGPRTFKGGRLAAVPITALWSAPGFREAAGYDASREQRRTELVAHVAELLKSNEAALAIAAEDDDWKRSLNAGGAPVLAEALCASSSWRAVLAAFYRAHEKMSLRRGAEYSRAATTIVEVLARVLPEVYGMTSLHLIPGGDGGQMVTLPVESQTLAELAMAAFDGRGFAYQEVGAKELFPRGRALFQLADEEQETGFDVTGDVAFREWLLLLAGWLKLDERLLRPLRQSERLDELTKFVDFQLERDTARFGEPRRYFLFSSKFAEKHGPFLSRVREKLPALHLVELAEGTLVQELEDLDLLQAILFRSFQARNLKT